jgi:hypothetical protein
MLFETISIKVLSLFAKTWQQSSKRVTQPTKAITNEINFLPSNRDFFAKLTADFFDF